MKNKKALFIINSLSNGGAERVCINLANKLIQMNWHVDFILLKENENTESMYILNEEVNVLNLNINTKSKIKELISIMLSIKKVNKYIKEFEQFESYTLITSHLPMANILTLLSSVKNRAIYVFHANMSYYVTQKQYLLKNIIKFMFSKKKIVAVSNGMRLECIDDYGFKEQYIKTIYNPLNINEIRKKMNEKIDIKDKYFLHIGRFSKEKRQDRMLEIFKKGNFYKNYKLIFCGTGELLEECKSKAKELGILDRVEFLMWQKNIYKYLKNAEILVCTSDCESFSMTLVEALCCGTKIVSSDCNFGPREIMVGEYANYLVKPDDIDGYITKINEALKRYPTEENPILKKCNATNVINEYIDYAFTKIK